MKVGVGEGWVRVWARVITWCSMVNIKVNLR